MAKKDNTFKITIDNPNLGYSPLAFMNSLTEKGGSGSASVMSNADVFGGDYLTQGPGLSSLTKGTEAGVVNETISFIMDKAVADSVTYGIGDTQLFKITPTGVTDDATFPQAITNCTDGESIQVLKGNLYYFFNKSAAGEIGKFDLSSTFDHDWGSTVPTGHAALEKAPHPSDKKEDILVFGNGRYTGVYLAGSNTLAPQRLDFGADAQVDDVLYNSGYWYLAVNSGVTGTNRTEGQIYLYDGAALLSTLADETGVGMQRIGFLYRINGIIYVAYQDLSTTGTGFKIGYINGKIIVPLVQYTGTLPTFAQKTLYKNTILFLASNSVFSAGSVIGDLPYQLSQLADGGYSTASAIAAPFGTPMVSSEKSADFTAATSNVITDTAHGLSNNDTLLLTTTNTLPAGLSLATVYHVIDKTDDTFKVSTSQGGSEVDITDTGTGTHTWHRYKLAQFSGYDTNCTWKSIVFPTSEGKYKGFIDEVIVLTKVLGENARCDLTVEANQGVDSSASKSIATTGKTRHFFNNLGLPSGGVEDIRIALDWSNGSATNDAAIRKIVIHGHFITAT